MSSKGVIPLIKATVISFFADRALSLAASLSYYAIFSVTPLLLIVLALVGKIFGDNAARTAVLDRIGSAAGESTRKLIDELMTNAAKGDSGIVGTIVGLSFLLIGATGLFGQLKYALNQVWNVRPKKGGAIRKLVRTRITGFLLVLTMAVALIVLLGLSTFISGAAGAIEDRISIPGWLLHLIDLGVSFGIIAGLLGVMYKYLPDAVIGWKECWIGAAMTAALLAAGKVGLGLYLGKSTLASTYGAAGSLVITLVWIYYTSAILLLGAELTQCYAAMYSEAIIPADWAETTDEQWTKPGKTVAVKEASELPPDVPKPER